MSIIVNADATSDLLNSYSYAYYAVDRSGLYHVILTDLAVSQISFSSANPSFFDPNISEQITVQATSSTKFYASQKYTSEDIPLIFTFDGTNWQLELPLVSNSQLTGTSYIFGTVISYTTFATTIPSGFPDFNIDSGITAEEIQQLINNTINTTTSITTSANNYQQQATNYYSQYQNGSISLSTLESRLNNIVSQLNALNNSSSATLADKVAINNALTQTQIINDSAIKDAIIAEMEEDLTTTTTITASISNQINNANQTFQNFTQGSVTQSEAVTQINQYITNLTQLITPQTPTADVEAINTAVNTINSIKNSITNYSDLDKDTSESAIQSDQEELDYLDELTGETLGTIQDISPEKEFSEQQKTEGTNILSVIWNNDLINKLIPICSCFMVVCVVLGIRYKV